jgi:imidazole glycerol phosphate synthase glutamine amidotransferase subunit
MTLAVVDYGAGNLRSVANALKYLGCSHEVCDGPAGLESAERIILPGVGHFGAAMNELVRRGLADAVVRRARAGVPLLGICLGLQLLFEASEEAPGVAGLGLLEGTVRRLRTRIVPHMGWNRLEFRRENPLTRDLPDKVYGYFANSFAADPADPDVVVAVTTQDDIAMPVIVGRNQVAATQFHPEKSGECGLAMLRNFVQC